MSDEIELTPDERELEKALRSLRPTPADIELIVESSAPRSRFWQLAAAATILVAGGAWLMWGPHEVAPIHVDRQVPVIAVNTDQPTFLVYRLALAKSSEELDALLNRHATTGARLNNDTLPKGVLRIWNANLNSLGEM